jgi:hypothetical protein
MTRKAYLEYIRVCLRAKVPPLNYVQFVLLTEKDVEQCFESNAAWLKIQHARWPDKLPYAVESIGEHNPHRCKPRNPARDAAYAEVFQAGLRIINQPSFKLRVPGWRKRYRGVKPRLQLKISWLPSGDGPVSEVEMRAANLIYHKEERGLSLPKCAREMGLPLRTVERLWACVLRGKVPRGWTRQSGGMAGRICAKRDGRSYAETLV